MWKSLTDFMGSVFTLSYRLERQEQGLKDLQREVRELTALVHRLAYEQQRHHERETHEREKFMLRIENHLLKANRQLPPTKNEHGNEPEN
jgi:hypothetical protein